MVGRRSKEGASDLQGPVAQSHYAPLGVAGCRGWKHLRAGAGG